MDEELSFYEKKMIVDVYLKKSFLDVIKQYTGLLPTTNNCYCPFHEDKHHPSAKFYFADDDDTFLYCFRDRKSYRVSDILLTFDRGRFNTELANAIKFYSIEGFKNLKLKLDAKRRVTAFNDDFIVKLNNAFKFHKVSCNDYIKYSYGYFEQANLKITQEVSQSFDNKVVSNVGAK